MEQMHQIHTYQTYTQMHGVRYDRSQETAFAERKTATCAEHLNQGYSTQNENNSNYSSIIMMNNSKIINLPRKEYDFSKNFYREYLEKKDIYDFNKTQLQSPILIENIDRKNTYYKEMSYNNGLHSDIYNLNDKEKGPAHFESVLFCGALDSIFLG